MSDWVVLVVHNNDLCDVAYFRGIQQNGSMAVRAVPHHRRADAESLSSGGLRQLKERMTSLLGS